MISEAISCPWVLDQEVKGVSSFIVTFLGLGNEYECTAPEPTQLVSSKPAPTDSRKKNRQWTHGSLL